MSDRAVASPLVAAPQVQAAQNPWILPGLAVLVELIYAAALYMAFIGTDKSLFNIMCGAAIAQAAIPLQWYFGSSKSSQDKDASAAASAIAKDATMAETVKALAVSAPAMPTAPITVTRVEEPDGTTTTTTAPVPPPPIPPEPEWVKNGWPSPAGPGEPKL